MTEILLLSPYANLTQHAQKLLKDEGVNFEIIDVPTLRSEEVVKGIDKQAQVIISRGGLAMLAKQYTNVPVVDIPVTLLDILGAVRSIRDGDNKKKVIISTANIIYDPQYISKIRALGIDFVSSADTFVSCHDWVELRIQSETLAKDGGYDVIIGDALVCAIAAKHGIPSILIESSEASLSIAISEAMRIVETNRQDTQIQIKHRKEILENGWVAHYSFRDILSKSHDLAQAIRQARLFAQSNGNVLIEGETGTGKELFAQSIHNESDRVNGPFVSVNCSAINENLFESELFGYVAGAFTGASKGGKKGLFECANNGTLFLDEISEIPINLQAKLLRVLQEKKLRRVGSEKMVDINARIICATNINLLGLADSGSFRRDLYYRLGELELYLPPLRDRREDILVVAESFLRKEAEKINRTLFWNDTKVLSPLLTYDWPGNIRELRNFIVKLVTYSEDGELTADTVDAIFRLSYRNAPRETYGELTINISSDIKIMEQEIFTKLLAIYDGDKEKLCRNFGISKSTLWRKLTYKQRASGDPGVSKLKS